MRMSYRINVPEGLPQTLAIFEEGDFGGQKWALDLGRLLNAVLLFEVEVGLELDQGLVLAREGEVIITFQWHRP